MDENRKKESCWSESKKNSNKVAKLWLNKIDLIQCQKYLRKKLLRKHLRESTPPTLVTATCDARETLKRDFNQILCLFSFIYKSSGSSKTIRCFESSNNFRVFLSVNFQTSAWARCGTHNGFFKLQVFLYAIKSPCAYYVTFVMRFVVENIENVFELQLWMLII